MIGALIMAAITQDSAAPARAAEPSRPAPAAMVAPPPGAARSVRGEGRWIEGSHDGPAGNRRYRLYLPAIHDPAKRQMLVVMLHGCTQDAADFARGTRIVQHAEREGFLALVPEQPERAHPKKCWNWYDPAHQRRGEGEPSLIDGMTSEVMAAYNVDPARVHLAGVSAGAAMTSLVAVAYPERYASIAVHSGLPWRAATTIAGALGAMATGTGDGDSLGAAAFEAMGARARPIPALVIHGGSDAVLHPANGRRAAQQWIVTNARAMGVASLTPNDESHERNGYHWTSRSHCDATGKCVVQEISVAELGHAWSGGSKEGTFTDERGPDAMQEIVRFFREHPKASGR